MTPEQERLLRRLALNDECLVTAVFGDVAASEDSGLPAKTLALIRIAALIATESALASYQWAVDNALAVGVREAEIIDAVLAVAPIVGSARVTSAASDLAMALGYDVDPRSEDS